MMVNSGFLLSICIPTYNRADLLEQTLASIVVSSAFAQGKIEIVLSDNASTDRTPEVCGALWERYPDRVLHDRQTTVIDPSFNYENALNLGRGTFLKLNNDNVAFAAGSLDRFVDAIEKYGDKYTFFLPVKTDSRNDQAIWDVPDVETLIAKFSFLPTAIHTFCIKREKYRMLDAPFRAWEVHFPHLDMIFRLMDEGEEAIGVFGVDTIWLRAVYNSTARNEAQDFGHNYISLLQEQRRLGFLSRRSFQREKRRVLFEHIIPLHFDFFHLYNSSRYPLPFFRWMKAFYCDWFFYVALVWIAFYWIISNVVPLHQMAGKIKRAYLRKKNG